MPEGMIRSAIGGFYEIESGSEVFTCKARGAFRHEGITPLPGDRVCFEVPRDGFARITSILTRRNTIKRPAVANIDILFIVVSAQLPEPDLLLTDKLILEAVSAGIEPVLIINKTDIREEGLFQKLVKQYGAFSVIQTSALESVGIEAIEEKIRGHICCFAGQSGVGKSSILNAVMKTDTAKTGDISGKTEHGRHTTRETRLFACCGGFIFDTPGFSLYETDGFDAGILEKAYPELVIDEQCRFIGCRHISEPGCAVKAMVKNGEIDGERYGRYTQLFEEFENRRKHRYD